MVEKNAWEKVRRSSLVMRDPVQVNNFKDILIAVDVNLTDSKALFPKSCSKISTLMTIQLFYSHFLNINRGSFHTLMKCDIDLQKIALRARKVSAVFKKRVLLGFYIHDLLTLFNMFKI